MTYEIQQILDRLATIEHPYDNDAFLTTNVIKNIVLEDDKLVIDFSFPRATNKEFSQFQRQLLQILKQELQIPKIKLNYEVVEIKENASRMKSLHPNALFLAVMSGKGGVGKSTLTYALAKAFTSIGKRVAIIDADVYGASIPQIMQIPKTPPVADGVKLKPYQKDDIDVMSSSFLIQDDMPVMWKGPMLSRLLQQFLYDVAWNDNTDIFLFDMPPGTGDVMFTLNEILPETKAVLITTPQEDAAYVTIKSGIALQELDIEAIGVIENMAYVACEDCDHKNYVFGKDGGQYVSEALSLPLFGTLPLQQELPDSEVLNIIEKILQN